MSSPLIITWVGSLAGVAGGIIGTYYSIRNTDGPRERAFMIRAAALGWIILAVLMAAMFVFPDARGWIWLPYVVVWPFLLRHGTRKHLAIRQEEQATGITENRGGAH